MKKLIDKFCSIMNRISWGKRVDATSGKFDIVPVSSNGKFDLFRKLNRVLFLQEALDCPIRAWDIWELGKGEPAVIEFLDGGPSLAIYNKRVAYCQTQDEVCSTLMDVSLSHDIVEFKLTKSNGHTWSILGIGVVTTTKNESNIDADLIDLLASASSVSYV